MKQYINPIFLNHNKYLYYLSINLKIINFKLTFLMNSSRSNLNESRHFRTISNFDEPDKERLIDKILNKSKYEEINNINRKVDPLLRKLF